MLAKLTMVTPSKKKGEFGFCTKETNVPLDNFKFEIRNFVEFHDMNNTID